MTDMIEQSNRRRMWEMLIPGYAALTPGMKKTVKRQYAAKYERYPNEIVDYEFAWGPDNYDMNIVPVFKEGSDKEVDIDFDSPVQYYSFADCPSPTVTTAKVFQALQSLKQEEKEEEKEQDMYQTEQALEIQQRNHMKSRIDGILRTKTAELREKFHMNSVQLKNKADVLAALKDGRITMSDDCGEEDFRYGFCTSMLTVHDPERDFEGFKAAEKLLGKAYTEAKDKIIVLPLEKGLEALNEFEATTA